MAALTINEAAETTGWSPRMLRYIEREGLIEPSRSAAGYRLYGPGELQRLRTLRELLAEHDISLGDVGFALKMSQDSDHEQAVQTWLASEPERPEGVAGEDWLAFEQRKHQRLLGGPAEPAAA